MKIQFDDIIEYDVLWQSVHDSIIFWQKRKQEAQGKICLAVDGTGHPYEEQYGVDMMVTNAKLLKSIEDDAYPGEYNSSIVVKTLKLP